MQIDELTSVLENTPQTWGIFVSGVKLPDRRCYGCSIDEAHIEYKNDVHLEVTPNDDLMGATLLLHPEGASRDIKVYPDDDHHTEHPRLHPLLQGVGGLALRKSRLLRADYWQHHVDHHNTFRGPELPSTEAEMFKRVVLNAADYIPEQGIAFHSPGNYYLKTISAETRQKMWERRTIRVESPAHVRAFMKQYLLMYDPVDVKEHVLEHFLATHHPIKRWKRAKHILDSVAQQATEPIQADFKVAYDRGLIRPSNSWRAGKFVVAWLANHEAEKGSLARELQRAIGERVGIAA